MFLKPYPWMPERRITNTLLNPFFIVLKCTAFKDYLFLLLLCSIVFSPLASEAQLLDSLKSVLKSKPTFDFRLDSRNNFISAHKASTFGLKIGFDYRSKLRFGLGYNFLQSKFYERTSANTSSGVRFYTRRLVLQYSCIYADYVYFNTKKWTFSVPVQLGFGRTFYREIFPNLYGTESVPSTIVLYEPCLSGEYRVCPWLAINANAGFRIVVIKGRDLRQRLTAPLYVAGISVYWTRLYKLVFPGKGEWYQLFNPQEPNP